jgi:DNA-binding CsgD family transcriptional regulator
VDADELLARGQSALRIGDAVSARDALSRAPRTPAVLERLSAASYVLMDYPRSIEELEEAHAGYRAAGDGAGATRTARTLAGLNGTTTGDWAIASGWIARAKSLLGDPPDAGERGWIALTEGMFEGRRDVKERHLRTAIALAREVGDGDLVFVSTAYLGASMVHDDRADAGMALLDEALAAVAGGEVEDFILVEEIFCQMFSACEHARDVQRAEQWIRVGEQIAERRRLPAVSAYCRTHYGGILTAAGRWPEADAALTEAVRVKQGRYDEAAQLLEDLADNGESVGPRAALHLARGETGIARELLDHAVQGANPGSSECVPLLALLVEAQLATGEDPEPTVDAMAACADEHPTTYTHAVVGLARGRLALARGEDSARSWLRDALAGFTQAGLPLEAALCRLELATACREARPDVAAVEARAALAAFERLQASRQADAATALLRQLGERVGPPRAAGGLLTKREQEVLDLVGAGLSNPEIADRLFISRKTVEHHVGNLLAKLGLRNRAEATAYAVRQEPVDK